MPPKPASVKDSLLITHKGCADGSGSVLMFLEAGGKRENVRFVAAGQVERMIKETKLLDDPRFIIFADVGIREDRSDYVGMLEKRGNLALLDHHKTSLHLSDRSWAMIDMGACGTELVRRYFNLNSAHLKRFASVVDDHDRWVREQLPHSERLTAFHYFVGQEQFLDMFTESFYVSSFGLKQRDRFNGSFLMVNELEMLRVVQRRQDELSRDALEKQLIRRDLCVGGRMVRMGYSFARIDNYSVFLDELLTRNPDVDVAVLVQMGSGTLSLRSRGNVDVEEIAKLSGGGGHASAAGCTVHQSVIADFISAVHQQFSRGD